MIIRGSIETLPIEVLEEVFSYLGDPDVVSVASVCLQWAGVCQRVARCRCSENIPDDILTEILSQQAWGVVDWVEVWKAWVGSGLLPEATPFQEKREDEQRLSYTQPFRHSVVDGDGVYTGDDQGGLEWRQMGNKTCIRTHLDDGNVQKICLMPTFGLVMVVGETKLHFFYLDHESNYWERLSADFQLTVGSNHHLSVFGPRFCVADDEGFIRVLEIYYVGLSVRTSEVCRLRQKLSWVQWTLWRDKVIALQTNGEILVFSLLCPNGQLMYKSEPYTVVMYKNPCWIFRDVVFCSSLATRGLLDSNYGPHTYVYMSDRWDSLNGTGYWMVGPVDDLSDESFLEDAARSYNMDQVASSITNPEHYASMMRGFCLTKIYPGLNSNDDVTCITMQRRLILCGTLYGSLLIFSADSASESSTNSKSVTKVKNNNKRKPRKLPPKHSKLEFDSKPLAKLKVSNSPIVQVDIGFTESSILLYYSSNTKVASKGGSDHICCMALPSLLSKPIN